MDQTYVEYTDSKRLVKDPLVSFSMISTQPGELSGRDD